MAIIVSPLSRAPDLMAARKPSRVVSLLDPLSGFPRADHLHHDHHLKVPIHDITEVQAGWTAPMPVHVNRIVEFVTDWDRSAPMLIHCYAGISRSAATAFIAACVHNPGADEHEIAWTLRQASTIAWPNSRIVALADATLGRSGRMSAAIEAIGPGKSWQAVGENTPFEIPSVFPDKKS
jgi:predicted protein tyrosine phosphatase